MDLSRAKRLRFLFLSPFQFLFLFQFLSPFRSPYPYLFQSPFPSRFLFPWFRLCKLK